MSTDSSSNRSTEATTWYKTLSRDELPEGRVEAANCGDTTVAVTRYDGEYAALDNNCPHQGGPLGEGLIEAGFLRCPWHGWDFDPLTGETPGPHDDKLGKISKGQRTGGWDVWQTDLVNPEFAPFANNCGGHGVFVDDPDDLNVGLETAIEHDGPALVEISADSDLV